MHPSQRAEFGIIMNAQKQCAVWPAQESPPLGWRFTAATGTKVAMQSRVDQQFVPTIPALPVDLDVATEHRLAAHADATRRAGEHGHQLAGLARRSGGEQPLQEVAQACKQHYEGRICAETRRGAARGALAD
jgi:uncharacterized protein YbdZ (MbtH family)